MSGFNLEQAATK